MSKCDVCKKEHGTLRTNGLLMCCGCEYDPSKRTLINTLEGLRKLQQENAELREMLKESRGAISACSIQESRSDGTENKAKIKALDELVESIDKLINKND